MQQAKSADLESQLSNLNTIKRKPYEEIVEERTTDLKQVEYNIRVEQERQEAA